jgi:hypothetical protein
VASVRLLKLEILGCALLLAVTIGVLLNTPEAPWADRERRAATEETQNDGNAPSIAAAERKVVRPPTPPPPKPPPAHLTGRLVLIDESGVERTDRSGTLYLTIELPDASTEVHRVEVKEGRFATDAYVGCFLKADTATIDGAYASVDLARTPLPETRALEVVARVPRKLRVLVTDAASGEALPFVTLRVATGPGALFPIDPERLDSWTRAGASPREIAPDLPPHEIWIDVAGYGYVRHAVAPADGGELAVPLARAATLRIQLTGAPPPPDCVLRFVDDAVPPRVLQELAVDRAAIVLDRLAPRRLTVSVTSRSRGEVELARGTVELTPDRVTDVVLDLAQ